MVREMSADKAELTVCCELFNDKYLDYVEVPTSSLHI